MKIPREYSLLIIIGLFILAYLLDLVVNPLDLSLPTPYHFFQPTLMASFPFSTFSVLIKAVAIFLTPLWLLSFFTYEGFAKPSILLVLAGLMQLYAIQDVATKAEVIPLEWALSLAASGFLLFIPTIFLFIRAFIISAHQNLTDAKMKEAIKRAQEEEALEKTESI